MNETITVYQLLGLVKDGKVPKHIKYKDYDLVWEKSLCYYRTNRYGGWEMFYFNLSDLNDTVEIIEDNDKLEKIKWNEKESRAGILRADQEIEVLAKRTETLKKKIAELVDHINKIEEALNVSKDN